MGAGAECKWRLFPLKMHSPVFFPLAKAKKMDFSKFSDGPVKGNHKCELLKLHVPSFTIRTVVYIHYKDIIQTLFKH